MKSTVTAIEPAPSMAGTCIVLPSFRSIFLKYPRKSPGGQTRRYRNSYASTYAETSDLLDGSGPLAVKHAFKVRRSASKRLQFSL